MDAYRSLPLASLRFGHECLHGDVNIRKPDEAGCAQLAESIRREGLLQALCVWNPHGHAEGPFYVIAGGRRLMALQRLSHDCAIGDVPCVVIDAASAADALAKSLITEDTHLPPHPVDRFETFQRLADRGLDAEAIAARFFIDKKIVRQSLALGALAPEVRDAWRAGVIDQATAQCFTLAENQEQQLKTFQRLAKKGAPIDATTVRKQFTGSEIEARRLLNFVTRAAYTGAGGALSEDLFTDSIVIHDFAKLKRLAEEKLEAEAARLKAEGWSFAEVQLTRRYGGFGSYNAHPKPRYTEEEKVTRAAIQTREREIEKALEAIEDADESRALNEQREELELRAEKIESAAIMRAYTPAQKAKLGCTVSISDTGEIEIDHGLTPPREQPAPDNGQPARRGNGSAAKPAEAPVDFDTMLALEHWRAAAAGETMQRDEDLALAVLLAHLQTSRGPLSIMSNFNAKHVFIPRTDSFAQVLRELRKQKTATLLSLLVKAIGEEVDLDGFEEDAFFAALDQKEYAKALARRFDAVEFFRGCSKTHLLAIITESWGAEHARQSADMSKHDLEAICLRNVVPGGWLPPELRTALYKPRAVEAAKPPKEAEGKPKRRGRPPGTAKPKPSAKAKRAAAKAFAP